MKIDKYDTDVIALVTPHLRIAQRLIDRRFFKGEEIDEEDIVDVLQEAKDEVEALIQFFLKKECNLCK